MPKIFEQFANSNTVGILKDIEINNIVHTPQRPAVIKLKTCDTLASCIGCHNPKCMKYSASEISAKGRLSEFPCEMNDSVCPVGAIVWEKGDCFPVILKEQCINCGLCASRCPLGAIYCYDDTAEINSGEPYVNFVESTPKNIAMQSEQLCQLSKVVHLGQYAAMGDIDKVYDKIEAAQASKQFPNLLTRNLLIALGNDCFMRRSGDVYIRIDALIETAGKVAPIEVEFTNAVLESPRAILDDIAVLYSRYGIDKNTMAPLMISFEFPNNRTEYWQVIKDINSVLGIKINSLTIGALILLMWAFKKSNILEQTFYADITKASIRNEIEKILGLKSSVKCNRAIFEPKK